MYLLVDTCCHQHLGLMYTDFVGIMAFVEYLMDSLVIIAIPAEIYFLEA